MLVSVAKTLLLPAVGSDRSVVVGTPECYIMYN